MIVDFHTHIFPGFFRKERDRFFLEEPAFESLYRSPKSTLVGCEELLRTMDEEGVDRSVIFGFPWENEAYFRRHNDYIIESIQRYPGRLIGFCCFSIHALHGAEEAARCLAAGLSGVGELAVYESGLSEKAVSGLADVMDVCLQRDVPVMLHTNEPVGHQYAGKTEMTLRQLYQLIKAYPSNRIVLAHWGGGLFFYALMKKEVGDLLTHVWFDTAASPYLYKPDIYRVAGDIIGEQKILFGSDYPLLKPGRYFGEMASVKLSTSAVKRICGENAARLLGL